MKQTHRTRRDRNVEIEKIKRDKRKKANDSRMWLKKIYRKTKEICDPQKINSKNRKKDSRTKEKMVV